MLPRLFSFEWGNFVFHLNGYGFSILCGTVAAMAILLRRARAAGTPIQPLLWVVMLSVAGGFLGARLAFALQYGRSPLAGGWVLYGGLLGGVGTALVSARRFGLPPLAVADLATPCLLLAAAFGRVGCFFAGCCFGAVWDGGWSYPASSHAWHQHYHAGLIDRDAARSLPTIPAPLLEAAALLLCFAAASAVARRRPKPGVTLAACGLLYACWRFVAEFWRGDHDPFWGRWLTFSQGISLAVVAASLILLLRRRATAPPALRTFTLGWRPAAQVSAILLGVALLSGSVGCSKQEREDVAEDLVEGCFESCMNSCIDICVECCSEKCKEECGSGRRHRTPPGPDTGPAFRLPQLDPGSRHTGKISVRGMLNDRMQVELDLAGTLQALEKDDAGTLLLRMEIQDLRVSVGALTYPPAKGWIDFTITSKGKTVLRTSTLPAETLGILKAIEPLTKGFLKIDFSTEPASDWAQAVERELSVPSARAAVQGLLELNGENRTFAATAIVSETATGEKRVQWIPRR
jgi:phosphatidylglycerol:prolipoprotein diacylglycerol transferase